MAKASLIGRLLSAGKSSKKKKPLERRSVMEHPFLVLAAIAALGLMYVVFPVVLQTFLHYRKGRSLACPEEGRTATVIIDAKTAARTAAVGTPRLQVLNCSFWPQKCGCRQGCLAHALRA
jgi:hypothetical protein